MSHFVQVECGGFLVSWVFFVYLTIKIKLDLKRELQAFVLRLSYISVHEIYFDDQRSRRKTAERRRGAVFCICVNCFAESITSRGSRWMIDTRAPENTRLFYYEPSSVWNMEYGI